MAAHQYVYQMHNLKKTYAGGKEVLKGISLSFLPDAKIGIVGHNGTGKSTLLKIMAGLDTEFSGEAAAAEGVTIGYLEQEPKLNEKLDVQGNILAGIGNIKSILDEFNDVSAQFADPDLTDEAMNALIERQAELQEQIDAVDGWSIDRTLDIAMDALRCPPADADISKLSGGEARRVALCALLLSKPDILLLDEPTNHLDAESIAWLERHLRDYAGMVLIVTHDRYFLDNITNWVLELDRGQGIPFEGNYSAWLGDKAKRISQESKEEAGRQKNLAREVEWINQSPKARQAKSKARISSYEDLLNQNMEKRIGEAQIVIPPGARLGDVVIEAENLSKGYNDRLLIDGLSFKLPAGGIVGIVGANGAGKSTLFKMITQAEQPDGGHIKIGETVTLGYVDQSREALDPEKAIWDEICDGQEFIELGGTKMQGRAYVGRFNFKGSDQQKKVGLLSGGERNRVHLAKMLKSGANVLLLDEPTNDLDVETLRALETALIDFAGCAVVISHDRYFLDRIATHILAFEGNSHVEWFEGNWQAYLEDKKSRLGEDAVNPHRLQYKKLTR